MTKEKKLVGIKSDGINTELAKITVRVTKDEDGATISLSDDKTMLFNVSLRDLRNWLREIGI